jgi:Flp pilus assembly protein TadD
VRIHLELEAWNDAAEEIARILPFEPGNAKLKTTLAYCYRRSGRFAEALILIRDLLAVSPGSEDLMKAAVYCLDRMGVRTTAVRAIESFVKENGESLSLSLMLGVLLFQDGALEKSAAVFRRAVSAFPRDWRAHRNLGMVYRKLGSADFAERFLAKAEELRKSAQATGRLAE